MSEQNYNAVTVFLVEDDDIDAMGIKRAFKKMRVANPIIRANDGVEALEMLEAGAVSEPFLVLLDLNMPRMGGLEFLRRMRADKRWEKNVVFVLTTSADDSDKLASYQQHVAGYIVKSKVDPDFGNLVGMLDYYWKLIELPC